MKRYVVVGAIVAGLAALLLLSFLGGRRANVPNTPESSTEGTTTDSGNQQVVSNNAEESASDHAESKPALAEEMSEKEKLRLAGPELAREYNETHNVPVAFYGKVVDQDGKPLSEAIISIGVQESSYAGTNYPFDYSRKRTPLQKVSGPDGRFEVTGVRGDAVQIEAVEKEGYEPELQRHYGSYPPQSTSFDSPAVLKLWSTNVHEPLIAGEKSFDLFSDGRRYAIDLVNGTMAEGESGDLVIWIKRPEKMEKGQRFDWSCELAIPDGGLLESQSQAMFVAPEVGYTNRFAFQAQASNNGPGSLQDQRFYVRLRNGQMYGRIVISFYPAFSRTKSGSIRLSYAVNPSGSRLLR